MGDLFGACDVSGYGQISLQEFLKGTRKSVTAQPARSVASRTMTPIEAFAETDVDGSGALSLQELRAALMQKSRMSEAAIMDLFGACDVSGDGQISLLEFLKGTKKLAAAGQAASAASGGGYDAQ